MFKAINNLGFKGFIPLDFYDVTLTEEIPVVILSDYKIKIL